MGKSTGWEKTQRTNEILADIYDLLQSINANLVAIGERKPAKKFTPYPRPGRDKDKNKRRIGKGAMPINDLREWFRRKREHG